jgi:predicted DNA-binding transcriptional regulator AlpA
MSDQKDVLPAELNRDRLLDSEQAALFLGFSLAHFRRLYRSGVVPTPLRIGERKLAWRAGTLADFVAAKESSAA